MLRTLWHKLFSQAQSGVPRSDRRIRVRQRSLQKPLLESLEERCLLSYQVTDLGTLSGLDDSMARGINGSGQVVGASYSDFSRPYAFLWDAVNGMQDLGTLPGDSDALAFGVNDSGQVVGDSRQTGRPGHAFLWDATNGMQDLGTLPGDRFSFGNGINDSGQVVGSAEPIAVGLGHAFLWDAVNGMQDLGTLPGGRNSIANAINNNGQVVGWSSIADGSTHAFLWDASNGMQDLGTLPGGDGSSFAHGINDSGQVVGISGSSNGRAFLWDAVNGMQDLGTLPGGRSANANGINSTGQVVGESERFDPDLGHYVYDAFIWQNGTMTDLNDLSAGSDLILEDASAINNAGQIVGFGYVNGVPHLRAYLLTPDSSALTAPAGTVHFTRGDAPAALLAGSTVMAADAGVHPFSFTPATLADQTSTVTVTVEATRIGSATVPETSDAPAPEGRMVQNATDVLFASSHRTQTAISSAAWEVEELELALAALQSP
jgi:probable HAF family extracellular repeat protein